MKKIWILLFIFMSTLGFYSMSSASYIVKVYSNGYVFQVDTLEEFVHHKIGDILPSDEIEKYIKIYSILEKIELLQYLDIKKQDILDIIQDDLTSRIEHLQVNNQNNIRFIYDNTGRKQLLEMNIKTKEYSILVDDISELEGYNHNFMFDEYFSPKYGTITLAGWSFGGTSAGELYSLVRVGNEYVIEAFSDNDMIVFQGGNIDTYTTTKDILITRNKKTQKQAIILCDFISRDCQNIFALPDDKGLRNEGLGSMFMPEDVYLNGGILNIKTYLHNSGIRGTDSFYNEYYKTYSVSLNLKSQGDIVCTDIFEDSIFKVNNLFQNSKDYDAVIGNNGYISQVCPYGKGYLLSHIQFPASGEYEQKISYIDASGELLHSTRGMKVQAMGDYATPKFRSINDNILTFMFSSGDAGCSSEQHYSLDLDTFTYTKDSAYGYCGPSRELEVDYSMQEYQYHSEYSREIFEKYHNLTDSKMQELVQIYNEINKDIGDDHSKDDKNILYMQKDVLEQFIQNNDITILGDTYTYFVKDNGYYTRKTINLGSDEILISQKGYQKTSCQYYYSNKTYQFTGIGFKFKTVELGAEILSIYPESPAQKIGIQIGDVINEVNGKTILGFTQSEQSGLFQGEEGSEININILRGGKNISYGISRGKIYSKSGNIDEINTNFPSPLKKSILGDMKIYTSKNTSSSQKFQICELSQSDDILVLDGNNYMRKYDKNGDKIFDFEIEDALKLTGPIYLNKNEVLFRESGSNTFRSIDIQIK